MDEKGLVTTYLQRKGCSKNSIQTYVRNLVRIMKRLKSKNIESENVTYPELMDNISHLRNQGISQRSIQSYLISIIHYYEALLQAGIVITNPGKYITLKVQQTKKLYPILSKEQLENLYTTFDIHAYRKTKPTAVASAIRNKIITGLMIYQGLTITALAGLTVEDVDVLGGTIQIKSSRKHAART